MIVQSSSREKELTKIVQLFDELNGKGHPDPDSFGSGYDYRIYNRDISKLRANWLISEVCSRLQKIDSVVLVEKHSLEMQTWWRDQKLVDENRLRTEIQGKKTEADRQDVISNLNDYERQLLGL